MGIEGSLTNNYGYQGAFSELDEDLGWNDFALRSYDPQIGRFIQMDPYDQFASPYIGMGNDPVDGFDPSGGDFTGWGDLFNSIKDFFAHLLPDVSVVAQRLKPTGSLLDGVLHFSMNAGNALLSIRPITPQHTVKAPAVGPTENERQAQELTANTEAAYGRGLNMINDPIEFAEQYGMGAVKGAGGFVLDAIKSTSPIANIKTPGQLMNEGAGIVSTAKSIWNYLTSSESEQATANANMLMKYMAQSPQDLGSSNTKIGLTAASVFVDPAAGAGELTAGGGENIALSVREHLDDFAKSVNGTTWETWGAKDFESGFMNTINNSGNKIHFNLTGIDNPWSAISKGAKGFRTGGFTNWELYQLYSNPAVLERTTFYLNGKVATSPF